MEPKVGRNAPCPCGSGKKYKHCCFGAGSGEAPYPQGKSDPVEELHRGLEEKHFSTEDEARAFVARYMERHVSRPVDDFHGLSPEQMHRFIHYPFKSPGLVTFPEEIEGEVRGVPLLTLVSRLVEGIGEEGLKATLKGNLPRNFCREVAMKVLGEAEYTRRTEIAKINKETDYMEFHVTRLVAEKAGLVKVEGKKFVLTEACRTILAGSGVVGLYPRLLKAYCRDFNWAYWGGGPDIPIIQHGFLFTLYLLHRFGKEWQSLSFYEDSFLRAFSPVLEGLEGNAYHSAEEIAKQCYSTRVLISFASFLGLAAMDLVLDDKGVVEGYRVIRGPMLDRAVHFHVGG